MAQKQVNMGTILAVAAVFVLGVIGVMIGFGQPSTGKSGSTAGSGKEETPKTAPVVIEGRRFTLDLALDQETRFRGLSGKTEIKEDGGLLFVFPRVYPSLDFVMRDCPIPIDIIYLDAAGRIVSWHKMVPEPPRTEQEQPTPPKDASGKEHPEVPKWQWVNDAYEARLKKYPSKFSAQFAIELRGNTLDGLKLKAGDKVEMDVAGLKKLAK
jgi:hypothetical protein